MRKMLLTLTACFFFSLLETIYCPAKGHAIYGDTPTQEYTVKAAFLLHFTKFIKWDKDAFHSERDPFELCVYRTNPFGPVLDTFRDKKILHRETNTRVITSVQQASSCHLLFVPHTEHRAIRFIGEDGVVPNLLLITEERNGAVITFLKKDGKIRFHIDQSKAQAAGLRISSQLLKLTVE